MLKAPAFLYEAALIFREDFVYGTKSRKNSKGRFLSCQNKSNKLLYHVSGYVITWSISACDEL